MSRLRCFRVAVAELLLILFDTLSWMLPRPFENDWMVCLIAITGSENRDSVGPASHYTCTVRCTVLVVLKATFQLPYCTYCTNGTVPTMHTVRYVFVTEVDRQAIQVLEYNLLISTPCPRSTGRNQPAFQAHCLYYLNAQFQHE